VLPEAPSVDATTGSGGTNGEDPVKDVTGRVEGALGGQ
jgi:hypothetical protein